MGGVGVGDRGEGSNLRVSRRTSWAARAAAGTSPEAARWRRTHIRTASGRVSSSQYERGADGGGTEAEEARGSSLGDGG